MNFKNRLEVQVLKIQLNHIYSQISIIALLKRIIYTLKDIFNIYFTNIDDSLLAMFKDNVSHLENRIKNIFEECHFSNIDTINLDNIFNCNNSDFTDITSLEISDSKHQNGIFYHTTFKNSNIYIDNNTSSSFTESDILDSDIKIEKDVKYLSIRENEIKNSNIEFIKPEQETDNIISITENIFSFSSIISDFDEPTVLRRSNFNNDCKLKGIYKLRMCNAEGKKVKNGIYKFPKLTTISIENISKYFVDE